MYHSQTNRQNMHKFNNKNIECPDGQLLNGVKSITGVLGKGNYCLYYQLCINSKH